MFFLYNWNRYVELLGQDDPLLVRSSLRHYNTVNSALVPHNFTSVWQNGNIYFPITISPSLIQLREVELVRLCLKHFRQQGYDAAFKALQEQTNVSLEDPKMSELHTALVVQGDFQKAENFIEKSVNGIMRWKTAARNAMITITFKLILIHTDGLMDAYLANQDYKATWSLQETVNSEKRPGMRGGHQLIIDSANSVMYLYGGWDGFEDLSDLWSYSIKRNSWTLIHQRSEEKEGPSPRSCHKMVYDSQNAQIFTLGRYMDSSTRTKEPIKVGIYKTELAIYNNLHFSSQSDFYLYDTKSKSWLLICDDTSQVGGPNLCFDHQMCIDIAKRNIYVFGGRILTQRVLDDLSNEPMYSGLFSYHIGTNTWTQILVDCAHPTASNPEVMSIKSRVTHSMLFHHVCSPHSTVTSLPSIG